MDKRQPEFDGGDHTEEHAKGFDVVDLPRRQDEAEPSALAVAMGADLCREAAPRAAKRFFASSFMFYSGSAAMRPDDGAVDHMRSPIGLGQVDECPQHGTQRAALAPSSIAAKRLFYLP